MTTIRQLVSSGSPFEPRVGMSRAVRVGSWISVSGTAPLGPDGRTVARGDPTETPNEPLRTMGTMP
jgi:enamine deaminase RidA (YjgF/YER057c/UK114 family)